MGLTTVGWVNPDGTARNYATGGNMPRALITEIRYPTAAAAAGYGPVRDAPPDYRQGPFPVIVFAHGYDTLPDPYDPLLDAWVSAGFVVVAPLFPDENEYQVNAYGGPDSYAGSMAQNDKINEPSDISYVIAALDAETPGAPANVKHSVTEPANASFLRGLVDPSRLALAGQSDGAEVVANLAFGSNYAATWEGLAIHPSALGVFSGQLWQPPVDSYGASGAGPPVLVAQSAADACNPPEYSTTIYNGIGGDHKWFLEFFHSTHIAPYWGLDGAAPVAEAVTTEFFEIALGWHPPSVAAMRARGNVAGVTSLTDGSEAPYMPWLEQNAGSC